MNLILATIEPMQAKDILFPLIGAVWACGTLVFNATCKCNEIRDRVILDHDEQHQINPAHREHLMRNDWLPYALSITLVCLGFAVLAAWTPCLLPDLAERASARPIAIWVSAFSAMMGIIWIPGAIQDWRAMRRAVKQHYDNSHKA